MRTSYLHARTIRRITQHLTHRFRESYTSPLHARTGSEKVGSLFRVYVDQLSVDAGVERFTRGAQVLEAFVHAAEAEADPDQRLRGLVARSLHLVTPSDPDPAVLGTGLRRILVSGRAGVTLQAMNDVGLLGRLIPEFGDLVAFFQYNVYHYYTADEHTLIALANVEALRERQGVLHEVFRALRRKEILLLAVLLHDIGKPRGVAECLRRQPASFRLPRALMTPIASGVSLVSKLTGHPQVLSRHKVAELYHVDWASSGPRLSEVCPWHPHFNLADGFADTLRWYRKEALL